MIEITIKGKAEEINALISEVQGRNNADNELQELLEIIRRLGLVSLHH